MEVKKLKEIRAKVMALRKLVVTFDEEVKMNALLFAIDEAIKAHRERKLWQ